MTKEKRDFEAEEVELEESTEALRAQWREPLGRGTVDRSVSPPAEIRKRLNISQQAFAGLLGVSVRTIQDWEQGRRAPSGPAQALLRIVDHEPEILLRVW